MKHLSITRRWGIAAVMVVAAALAGCASGPREITANVQTYANMGGISLPATYRMEVLPSQSQQQSFVQIETAAQQALQRVGLSRDTRPDLARLVVQVGATASQGRAYHPAYDDWFYGPRFGLGWGFGGPHMGMGMSWMDAPPMVYFRSVRVVIRDAKSQQIVYETSAEYDEIRPYDPIIWDVLFDSALSDFPAPKSNNRQVRSTLTPVPDNTATSTTTSGTPAVNADPSANTSNRQ